MPKKSCKVLMIEAAKLGWVGPYAVQEQGRSMTGAGQQKGRSRAGSGQKQGRSGQVQSRVSPKALFGPRWPTTFPNVRKKNWS